MLRANLGASVRAHHMRHWSRRMTRSHPSRRDERLSLWVESMAVIAAWNRVLTLRIIRVDINRQLSKSIRDALLRRGLDWPTGLRLVWGLSRRRLRRLVVGRLRPWLLWLRVLDDGRSIGLHRAPSMRVARLNRLMRLRRVLGYCCQHCTRNITQSAYGCHWTVLRISIALSWLHHLRIALATLRKWLLMIGQLDRSSIRAACSRSIRRLPTTSCLRTNVMMRIVIRRIL